MNKRQFKCENCKTIHDIKLTSLRWGQWLCDHCDVSEPDAESTEYTPDFAPRKAVYEAVA